MSDDYFQQLIARMQAERPIVFRDPFHVPDEAWVEYLEKLLEAAGYEVGDSVPNGYEHDVVEGTGPDDHFDVVTFDSVRAFQRDHNLVDDGIVGPTTWAMLEWRVNGGESEALAASTADSSAMAIPEADNLLDDENNAEAYDNAYKWMNETEAEDFHRFIEDYTSYRYPAARDDKFWSHRQLELFEWADSQPDLVHLSDLERQGYLEHMRTTKQIFADGRVETQEARDWRQRRDAFLRGGRVMRSGPFGGMTYFAVKAAGGSEEQALSAGEFANTAVSATGTYQKGSAPVQVQQTQAPTTPVYGQQQY